MLEIKNFHAKISHKEIFKGLDLHVGAGEVPRLVEISLERSVG